jgi:hypothetical protein
MSKLEHRECPLMGWPGSGACRYRRLLMAPKPTPASRPHDVLIGSPSRREWVAYCRNGLVARSYPIVLAGPWPQMNDTSSPSGNNFSLIEPIRVW